MPVVVYSTPEEIGQSVELQTGNTLGVCTGTEAPIVTTSEASGPIIRPDTSFPVIVIVVICGEISGSGSIFTENVSSTLGHGPNSRSFMKRNGIDNGKRSQ